MKSLKLTQAEWAWVFFDFANSAYATSIMAGFFPILFKNYYGRDLNSEVSTAYLGLSISVTSILLSLSNPLFGYWADHKGVVKRMVFFFSILCWSSLVALVLSPEGAWQSAILAYSISLFSFTSACSLYDALIKNVTQGQKEHLVSSVGYSLGYLGGGILFSIHVLMVNFHSVLGFSSKTIAAKWAMGSVVIWWAIFSLPLAFKVKESPKNSETTLWARKELLKSLKIFLRREIVLFLLGYYLYIDVVYTIIGMATDYGSALGLGTESLIQALLLVQWIGFPATWFWGILAKKIGAKPVLYLLLGCYAVTILVAYSMQSSLHFWVVASLIGLAQGGVQALSRSLLALQIKPEESGHAFGVFNLVGRLASILGPLVVSGVTYISNSHRLGILSLLPILFLGAILLASAPLRGK